MVIRSTLVQLETPDAMRGRVSAVNFLFVGTSNQLGEFESGTTAALFGTVPAVVIGGIGTILVAILGRGCSPRSARSIRCATSEGSEATEGPFQRALSCYQTNHGIGRIPPGRPRSSSPRVPFMANR